MFYRSLKIYPDACYNMRKDIFMKCLICGKEFDTKSKLWRHVNSSYAKEKSHLPILVYRCEYEGETIFSKKELSLLYEQGMSTNRMIKLLNVNKNFLLQAMHYYDIKFRNPSEQGKNRAKVFGVWNRGLTKFDHPSIMKYAKSRMGKDNPYYTAPNFDERRRKLLAISHAFFQRSSPSRNPKTTEMRVIKVLTDNKISFKRNFCIKMDDGRWRLFDFLIEGKLLLELQGDYWHANPQFYKADDRISVRSSRKEGSLAIDIWKYDEEKKQLGLSKGYVFMALWEHKIKAISDSEILNIITSELKK